MGDRFCIETMGAFSIMVIYSLWERDPSKSIMPPYSVRVVWH